MIHGSVFAPRLASGVLLLALALVPGRVEAQRAEGAFQRTLTVTGTPQIEVSAASGRIDVRPGPAGQVAISARIRATDGWGGGWLRRSALSAEERVRRVEANPPIQQSGSVVRVGYFSNDDWRDGVSISYTLTVPPPSSLTARTGSGSQQIEGITGGVEAHTGSGSLTFRHVGPRLHASSGSGSITADGVGGSLHASSGSGSIRATAVAGAITARTSSGSIDIAQEGGGDVEVSSSSGSVRLRGVRGGLHASTSSGGLSIQGELAADWRVSASSGSVTLAIPHDQGFELDANTGSGGINVDFPVTVTGPIGRRSLKGSSQGGGPLLRVRTSSGGITIQKRT